MGIGPYLLRKRSTKQTCFTKASCLRNIGKNMSLQVKKAILDDDFWMLNEATVKFLTPLHAAIIQLEADVPNLAEVFQLYSKVQIGMMENIETIPLIEGEQETIATILDVRENFCIKMIHKSAYFLDSRYHGEPNFYPMRTNLQLFNLYVNLERNSPLLSCWMLIL